MQRSNQNQNNRIWKRKQTKSLPISRIKSGGGAGEFKTGEIKTPPPQQHQQQHHQQHQQPYQQPYQQQQQQHQQQQLQQQQQQQRPNQILVPTLNNLHNRMLTATTGMNEKLYATLIHTTEQWAPVVIVPIIFDYAKSLWDTQTAICIRSFRGSQVAISALLSLADGRLVSGSDSLRIWNLTEEVLTPTKILDPSHSFCLAYLSEQKIASSSLLGIKIWDLKTESCIGTIKDHMIVGPLVSFFQENNNNNNNTSNKGNKDLIAFATAIYDKDYIKIWNVEQNICVNQFREHTDLIRVLCSLPNDGILLSGSRDKKIKIWDLEKSGVNGGAKSDATCGAPVHTLEGHTGGIRALLAISNNQIISASSDTSIKIWDLRSGLCTRNLNGHERTVSALGCLDDGLLISGSSDKTAKIWDLNKNQIVKELNTPAAVESLTVLGDGRLVLGLHNSKITVWEGR